MFHIVLFQPEIPPNTGNIVRLTANAGCVLHLIEPLGFRLDEKSVRRAGMDYAEFAAVQSHASWADCQRALAGQRFVGLSTKATRRYDEWKFAAGDVLVFGPETRGLPSEILDALPAERRLRVPMRAGNRSINLSNTVAIVLFEAWRQLDFDGGS